MSNPQKIRYTIQNKAGQTVSELTCYDYNIEGFDWILIADIMTKYKFRKRGLATRLINQAHEDIVRRSQDKGTYLFVKINNDDAIRLYKKLGYNILKTYVLNNILYYIMYKGNADITQFYKMSFT